MRNAGFLLGMFAVVMPLFVFCGCLERSAQYMDKKDKADPFLQQATAKISEGDNDAAIALLNKALEANPVLGRAHLEMALLMHDKNQPDYVRAIYHYERYLELRENNKTEKKAMIEGRIRQAKQKLAAEVFHELVGSNIKSEDTVSPAPAVKSATGAEVELAAENKALLAANEKLKQDVETLEMALAKANERRSRTMSVENSKPKSPVVVDRNRSVNAPRRYSVKPGDTLSRIADSVYGDAEKWVVIHKANREILGDSTRVKVGQELIVP